jgi:hypothetical protein
MLDCTLQVFIGFVCKPICFLHISIYSAFVLHGFSLPILFCFLLYGCHCGFKVFFFRILILIVLHCEFHYGWDCKTIEGVGF